MGFWSGMGKLAGGIYDVRADKWIGLGYLKNSLSRSTRIFEEVLIPGEATKTETFDEAMKEHGVSEQELADQINKFTRLFWFYSFFTIGLISYTVAQAFNAVWFGVVMGLALTFFIGAHMFRYHYWRYLLMKRELGLTPKDWLRDLMGQNRE